MSALAKALWRFCGPLARRNPKIKTVMQQGRSGLHVLHHALGARFPGVIQPHTVNLTVAITARCNLRCQGCLYERGFMPGQQLSLPMMRDLLTDAQAVGIRSVRLYGGEPLLHPDLPAIARHSLALGLRTYVTTNGILLGARFDELHQAGLRDFTIGFYGTGAAYDSYVQRPNSFARFEASLASIRERHGMTIGLRLNWLLMRPTCSLEALHEAWQFALRYAAPLQIDLIHYSLPYFTEGNDRELQFRAEDRPRIEAVVDELLRLKAARPDLLEASLPGLRSIPDWLIRGPGMRVPCDKYRMVWVGADGTVQLCYVTFKLGNLHQQRLRELLYTKAHTEAARSAFALKCPNCHCGYDERVRKHLSSRRAYGQPQSHRAAGEAT